MATISVTADTPYASRLARDGDRAEVQSGPDPGGST